MKYEETVITIPLSDALLIMNSELEARSLGYYDHLNAGGEGDCAEEAGLEALYMAIQALEKQVTMRATASFAKYYECPKCGELLETVEPYEYCWHCGQRISQSEGE